MILENIKQSISKKLLPYAMWIVIIAMAGMTLFNFYQQFWPFKTLKINSVTVLTPTVKGGELFEYSVDFCRYTDKPITGYKTLVSVDNSNPPFALPSATAVTPLGCRAVVVKVPIFVATPPGLYYISVDAEVQINPQRSIGVKFKTDNFTIR